MDVRLARKQSGFTLIEVLIAIMITALIGIGANEVLGQAIDISQRTQEKLESMGDLQKAVLIMTRDFRQVAARSIRDEFGDQQPAVSTHNEEYKIAFTRGGWRNPLGDVRSEFQRVAYSVEEGVLKRHHWFPLDQAQDSTPVERDLLNDVEEFQIRFLDDKDAWVDEWPPASSSGGGTGGSAMMAMYNTLPKAVQIRFTLKEFGQITKLYDLGAYMPGTALPGGPPPPPPP